MAAGRLQAHVGGLGRAQATAGLLTAKLDRIQFTDPQKLGVFHFFVVVDKLDFSIFLNWIFSIFW